MTEVGRNHSVYTIVLRDILGKEGPMITMVAINFTIALVGIIGNSFAIVVLSRTVHKSVVDTTSWLILNLAICNFCDLAVYVPLRNLNILTSFNNQGRGFIFDTCCRTVSFIRITFAAVGFFTIAAISLVRYPIIWHPLKARRFITTRNTLMGILGFWIFSASTSLPFPLRFTYVAEVYLYDRRMDVCLLDVFNDESKASDWIIYYTIISTVYFVLPLVSSTYFYTAVFIELHGNQDDLQTTIMAKTLKSRRNLAKRLLFIAALFVLLQSPMFLVYLLMTFGVELKSNPLFTMIVIETLTTINAALNPFIYCAQSRSLFRKRMFKFLNGGDISAVPENPTITTRKKQLQDRMATSTPLSLLLERCQQETDLWIVTRHCLRKMKT